MSNATSTDTLYVLVHSAGQSFKIGITADVEARTSGLARTYGGIDLARSYVVQGDRSDIQRLEKTLHFLFNRWNAPREEGRDGFTEWFDAACFDEVRETVDSVRAQAGATPRVPRPLF